MKKVMRCIGFYMFILIITTIVFAVSFRTPLFKSMTVYYYRALLLLVTTGVSILIITFILNKKLKINDIEIKDIIISFILSMSLLLVFVSTATVSMDRSISVFILADMANNSDKVYSDEEIEHRFLDIYMGKYHGMERRFEEQLLSGNIIKVNNGYKISESGENLIGLFKFISKIFPVDNRFLYPPKL
ncbi:hypothetical protein ACTPC6_09640 [Clostridioides difficile]